MSKTNPKTVRVTIELPGSALRLLRAKAELSGWSRWMPSYDGDEKLPVMDIGSVVAWLIYLEARGAPAEQIHAATPPMWRDEDSPVLIHDERKVYQDGELVGSGG